MGIAATRIQQQQQQQQQKRNTASSTRTTTNSTDTNQRGTTSNNHNGLYLFYLIHRTWAVVVAETKVSRFTNRKRSNSISSTISSSSSDSSLNSRYSYCSCDYCKNRNDFSDCTSDLQSDLLPTRMPPNSDETRRIGTTVKKQNEPQQSWLTEEDYSKEKQRPPIYNPEDYAVALRKWAKRSSNNTPTNGTQTLNGQKQQYGLYESPGGSNNSQGNTNTTGSRSSRTNSAPPSTSNSSSLSGNNNKLLTDTLCMSGGSSPGGNMNMALGDCTLLRDYRNPMLTTPAAGEMSLRQFSSVSELLSKLRADLRFAFPSFVQEFVGEPLDGVTLLLELLRGVQLSQAGGTMQRVPPAIQRRALLDELVCLQCLISCCIRHNDAIRRLASSPAGLYTLAVGIMSNVSKSRIIALKLLTMACEPPGNGHIPVSESLSTLRLRFGEPVRFRFLVGVLSSSGNHGELLAAGLRFLNAFMLSAGNSQKRLYVQAELEQAGFDINVFKKITPINSPFTERVFAELEKWENSHVDIQKLTSHAEEIERQNNSLKEKMRLLERRVKILQEEKGILMSLEQCLKDRCSELQEEVSNKQQGKSNKIINARRASSSKREDSTPAEDEGISSSERSLSPDDDIQREPMVYEVINVQNDTILVNTKGSQRNIQNINKIEKINNSKKYYHTQIDGHEDETTIEEVIEELKNIINDAETENSKANNNVITENKNNCIQIKVDSQPSIENIEAEIVPSNLHPQPPRKTKSLIHLYFPANNDSDQYECRQQEIFFDEEENQLFTSDDDSDSLLSASKCQNLPRVDRQEIIENSHDNRALLNSIMDARDRAEEYERRRQKARYYDKPLIPPNVNVKDANIKSVKHSSIDGLFIVDINSPTATPVLKHNKQIVETSTIDQQAIADKIKSKSLDRIDEGLNSMVDIVLTSDYQNGVGNKCLRKQSLKQNKTKPPQVFVHVARNRNSNTGSGISQQNVTTITSSSYYEDKHRVFLPSNEFDTNNESISYLQTNRLILPNDSANHSTSTFSIKRGQCNAGMYSGSNHGRKLISSIPSSDYRSMSPMAMAKTNSQISISKVTDLPSGLY